MRAEISDACRLTAKDCDELKSVKRLVMKNLDKRLLVSRHVELATLLDPATVSLLGSSDSNKEEALYSAVMASRASQLIAPVTLSEYHLMMSSKQMPTVVNVKRAVQPLVPRR
jgi:hypothetical protein